MKFVYSKLREQETIHISKVIDPQNEDKNKFGSLDFQVKHSAPLSLIPYIEPSLEEAREMDRILESLLNTVKMRANEYLYSMNPMVMNTF